MLIQQQSWSVLKWRQQYQKVDQHSSLQNLLYALYDLKEIQFWNEGPKMWNYDENKSISQTDKAYCENEISLDHLENAMKGLPLHKNPGLDGLSVEFYRTMWNTIEHDFYQLVNEISNDN